MAKDIRIKDYFIFTQHSLTTFDKCPLKFEKKYLENLKWENFTDEDILRNIKRGLDFHVLANRYFMGIDVGLYKDSEEYESLNGWIDELKNAFTLYDDYLYLPEYKLRKCESDLKIEANYDLIVVQNDSIGIYDWKTRNSSKKLDLMKVRKRLTESLQSVVYLYVLYDQIDNIINLYKSKTGITLNKDEIEIKMHYWMPEKPYSLAKIMYNEDLHKRYENIITDKINKILNYDFKSFNKELYEKSCKYCEFNWFCNNKRVDFKEKEENEEFVENFDWDEIEEVF